MAISTIIGVDVGGTKIQAGLITRDGYILKRFKVPTEAKKGRATVMKNITHCIDAVKAPGMRAIGVGLAGIVDYRKGIYLQGPNFPTSFKNVPIAAILKRTYGVPVTIDNDVHCFTLAEAIFGQGKGKSTIVGVTLGTGIGGGIVIDGRLYRGRNNAAGELGHMTILSDANTRCSCGQFGHLEALASGSAMSRLYATATGNLVDAHAVEKAADSGDKNARAVLAKMSKALALGLTNIIHILNPDIITVGGGLIRVKALWNPMLTEVKKLTIYPVLRTTPIVRSKLGDDANLIGASLLTKK